MWHFTRLTSPGNLQIELTPTLILPTDTATFASLSVYTAVTTCYVAVQDSVCSARRSSIANRTNEIQRLKHLPNERVFTSANVVIRQLDEQPFSFDARGIYEQGFATPLLIRTTIEIHWTGINPARSTSRWISILTSSALNS